MQQRPPRITASRSPPRVKILTSSTNASRSSANHRDSSSYNKKRTPPSTTTRYNTHRRSIDNGSSEDTEDDGYDDNDVVDYSDDDGYDYNHRLSSSNTSNNKQLSCSSFFCRNICCFHNTKQRWRVIGGIALVIILLTSFLATLLSLVHLSRRHQELQQAKEQGGEVVESSSPTSSSIVSGWWSYLQLETKTRVNKVKTRAKTAWHGKGRWIHPFAISSGQDQTSLTNAERNSLIEVTKGSTFSTDSNTENTTNDSQPPEVSTIASLVPPQYQHSTTMQMIFTRQYLTIANQTKAQHLSSLSSSSSSSQHSGGDPEILSEDQHHHSSNKKKHTKTTIEVDKEIDTSIDRHAHKPESSSSQTATHSHHQSKGESPHDDDEIWSDGIHTIALPSTNGDESKTYYDIYLQNPSSLISSATVGQSLPATAVKGVVVLLHSCTTVGDVWWNQELVRSHYLKMGSATPVTLTTANIETSTNDQSQTMTTDGRDGSQSLTRKKNKKQKKINLALPIESQIASTLLKEGYVVMAFTLSSSSGEEATGNSGNHKKPCWKKEDAIALYHSIQHVIEPLLLRLPSLSVLPIHMFAIGNGGIFLQNHVLPTILQKTPSLTFSLSSSSSSSLTSQSDTSLVNKKHSLEWLQQSAIAQLQGLLFMHCGLYNQQALTSIYKNKVVHQHQHHHRTASTNSSLSKVSKTLKLMLIDSSRNGEVASHNQQTTEHLKPQVKKAIENVVNSISASGGGSSSTMMVLSLDGSHEESISLVDHYVQHLVADPYPLTEEVLLSIFTPTSRKMNSTTNKVSSSIRNNHQHSLMISQDEAKALLIALKKEQFLWPANSLLVKDPTDPIYIEAFKNIIRKTLPRFSVVVDNMHTSSNNHIYFSEDDPFQLRYGKHALSSLLQIVKFAWGFKEPTDEFSEEILQWMAIS